MEGTETMAKKIRIGFIGCGGIATGHYQRLHATKKAQVVALNEPNPDKLERFRTHAEGSADLPVYADYKDMLKNEQLDGVVILSPHTVHFEQASTALRKGLHVLAEKPMVCTINHAKALIQTARKAKRV
ncbi:MAG TPA: Gfo/Idh/MocA family oxidoreductase, partial [Candidatus Hydrogenedentes bacterium]|nr:Gfo/Idh/MocA family oxidoreductase [Candidatus Hydrogenedentota bacterium]